MAICVSIVTSLENGMDLAEMSNIYGGPGFLGEYNSALLSFPFEIYKERLSAFVTAKCSFNHKKKIGQKANYTMHVSSNLYFFMSSEGIKRF